MNNATFKLLLSFVTPDGTYTEHESIHTDLEDILEEADEIAFATTGYPTEVWHSLHFDDVNQLFTYYPNEDDRTSRYKLSITEASE
jgi:hypothetical protein